MPSYSNSEGDEPSSRGLRLALGAAMVIGWINLATTGRWADEPGALHGWRLWPYVVLLLASTLVVVWPTATNTFRNTRRAEAGPRRYESIIVALGGCGLLAAALLSTFPLSTWNEIPFYDDWPGLLQLTLNGIDALRHGTVAGWQWAFLGGYHTSADLSQSLAIPAWLPIAVAGPTIGFHLFLAAIVLVIPLIVRYDVGASDGATMGAFACGVSGIVVAGYFATVMQSGMANSTAGAAAAAAALASSHAARRGRWWGGPALVLALTLTLYSHAAFFGYAGICLLVECLYYRDVRALVRLTIASAAAFVAALPVHWELVRYPAWFATNNLYAEAPAGFDWGGLVRQVWYATEMLGRPDRWFNDYSGLTSIWLIPIVWMAWRDRSRTGFYAWATLAIVLSLRLNSPQLGLVSGRQVHILPVVTAPALAGLIGRYVPGGLEARAILLATIACFIAIPFAAVPHRPDVHAFNPALVERIGAADGHLVLLENNPHWDMIGDAAVRSERSRFDVHYEALLPPATGRLFYGQPQDGYHRSVFRGHSLAGGAFHGEAIGSVPYGVFIDEMRKWGVASLFVWSEASKAYLGGSEAFVARWHDDQWIEFALVLSDGRAVVTSGGSGALDRLTPVGGEVRLTDVPPGTPVIVRTHFHPAWSATANGMPVPLRQEDGQMAFDAPSGTDIVVELAYDRRPWLSVLALLVLAGAIVKLMKP